MALTAHLNRIAFINLRGQLSVIAPDGRDARVLTTEERIFQCPTWSPDNGSIAVIGSTEHEAGIYLVHEADALFNSAVQRIYNSHTQPPIYLSWAPDSSTISMLTIHPTYRLALYLLSTNSDETTSNRRPLIAGQPCFWHWHADSRGLLVHVDLGRESAQVAHIRWRGETSANIQTVNDQPGYFQTPGISQSGRHLAYAQRAGVKESQLLVASRERQVVLGRYPGMAALTWSPTRDQLAFIHPNTPAEHFYGPLRVWDAESSEIDLLNREPVLAFFWAPDGEQIAYLTVVDGANREPAANYAPTTNGQVHSGWPFMPGAQVPELQLGLNIVHMPSGRSRLLCAFEPPALFVNQFLPFFDQYAKSQRLWSPDSRALVLTLLRGGRSEICIVPTDGAPPRAIAEGLMATWSW